MSLSMQQALEAALTDPDCDLPSWLSRIIDGEVPAGVKLPPAEQPLDALFSSLRGLADAAHFEQVSQAAADLCIRWMERYSEQPRPPAPAVRRLSGALEMLARIPAPPQASGRLLWLYLDRRLATLSYEHRHLQQQLLVALAISPPDLTLQQLEALFAEGLKRPNLAGAGFSGLLRLSPALAVKHLETFLDTAWDNPGPRHTALWSLFRTLERLPAIAAQLRQRLADRPDLIAVVTTIIGKDLNGAERFPEAWAAFSPTPGAPQVSPASGLKPLTALSPSAEAAIEKAGSRSKSPLLAA
ncbi:MAG: hypothetical protein ACKVVP_15225 [Chloroflexota bacterium]